MAQLRNVLQDKEKTQEKLFSELEEMEQSLVQQAGAFEEQNARLRQVLEQKELQIERLRGNGTSDSVLNQLDFDADGSTLDGALPPLMGMGLAGGLDGEGGADDNGERPMSV